MMKPSGAFESKTKKQMQRIHQKLYEVPFSDVNAMDHVDNQHYLRWMMEVAFEHMEALGWPLQRFIDQGTGFVVKSHFIDYLAPTFESEQLIKLTWISELTNKRATRQYQFYKLPDFKPFMRAETKWVFVDRTTGRPIEMSSEVFNAILVASDQDVADFLERIKTTAGETHR